MLRYRGVSREAHRREESRCRATIATFRASSKTAAGAAVREGTDGTRRARARTRGCSARVRPSRADSRDAEGLVTVDAPRRRTVRERTDVVAECRRWTTSSSSSPSPSPSFTRSWTSSCASPRLERKRGVSTFSRAGAGVPPPARGQRPARTGAARQ